MSTTTRLFLGYPSVQLLGQRVDAFGLATAEAKLATIQNLDFPTTLTKLEHYLGLTGYLRQYIPHYAAIVKPLQRRKTLLNRTITVQGTARKRAAGRTGIAEPTPKELNAFHHLQRLFARPTLLAHFNLKRQLYINIDASKEFGFGAHVYHTKTDTESISGPKNTEPILFLSWLLTDAETRY